MRQNILLPSIIGGLVTDLVERRADQLCEVFGISGPAYTWAQPIPPELVPEELAVVAPFDEADPVPSCRNADRPYGPDNYVVTVDGFVVSANVEVGRALVLDTGFRWSDHNPLYSYFVLL